MRFQGKIKSWNQSKGFGFISPNDESGDLFVHVTQFINRSRKPQLNDLVTYEIKLDEKKRNSAINVKFVGDKEIKQTSKSLWNILIPVLIISLVLVIVIGLYQDRGESIDTAPSETFDSIHHEEPKFTCAGKTHCSEMRSCEEATFYQKNCTGTEMDGDNDGIPCEQQWCN